MSRIGKQPVPLPDKVQVKIDSRQVAVSGPKGNLTFEHHPMVSVSLDEKTNALVVTRKDDAKFTRSLHGMTRAMLTNMVTGVSQGFERIVLIEGVGYGAALQGKALGLNVGFANQVLLDIPQGVEVKLTSPQRIVFSGPDKQAVNAFAARVRLVRVADPYHQKGMRYDGETIRRKTGKAFASGPA